MAVIMLRLCHTSTTVQMFVILSPWQTCFQYRQGNYLNRGIRRIKLALSRSNELRHTATAPGEVVLTEQGGSDLRVTHNWAHVSTPYFVPVERTLDCISYSTLMKFQVLVELAVDCDLLVSSNQLSGLTSLCAIASQCGWKCV